MVPIAEQGLRPRAGELAATAASTHPPDAERRVSAKSLQSAERRRSSPNENLATISASFPCRPGGERSPVVVASCENSVRQRLHPDRTATSQDPCDRERALGHRRNRENA